jgi:hypothetical protein
VYVNLYHDLQRDYNNKSNLLTLIFCNAAHRFRGQQLSAWSGQHRGRVADAELGAGQYSAAGLAQRTPGKKMECDP